MSQLYTHVGFNVERHAGSHQWFSAKLQDIIKKMQANRQ